MNMRVTESNRGTREETRSTFERIVRFSFRVKMLFKCSESRKLVLTINLPFGEPSYLERREERSLSQPASRLQSQLVSNAADSLSQWNWLYSKMSPKGKEMSACWKVTVDISNFNFVLVLFASIALCNAYLVVECNYVHILRCLSFTWEFFYFLLSVLPLELLDTLQNTWCIRGKIHVWNNSFNQAI